MVLLVHKTQENEEQITEEFSIEPFGKFGVIHNRPFQTYYIVVDDDHYLEVSQLPQDLPCQLENQTRTETTVYLPPSEFLRIILTRTGQVFGNENYIGRLRPVVVRKDKNKYDVVDVTIGVTRSMRVWFPDDGYVEGVGNAQLFLDIINDMAQHRENMKRDVDFDLTIIINALLFLIGFIISAITVTGSSCYFMEKSYIKGIRNIQSKNIPPGVLYAMGRRKVTITKVRKPKPKKEKKKVKVPKPKVTKKKKSSKKLKKLKPEKRKRPVDPESVTDKSKSSGQKNAKHDTSNATVISRTRKQISEEKSVYETEVTQSETDIIDQVSNPSDSTALEAKASDYATDFKDSPVENQTQMG
ncbi:unnamed protein product [Bursaphelenchus okinawaensis]|uniref:Uncharacterized protein n=1 Tax=Bursaphelenchus okinawaensis TaxID=465554 RepID=A0A811L6D3_9BILA|nr:unnamed protein product [Bursaphelenchus okinawaensis]CAG9118954.1 unnamed protein product [Bursaphelenchus okinawaensis]